MNANPWPSAENRARTLSIPPVRLSTSVMRCLLRGPRDAAIIPPALHLYTLAYRVTALARRGANLNSPRAEHCAVISRREAGTSMSAHVRRSAHASWQGTVAEG